MPTEPPSIVVGIDLSDAYAQRPRPNDLAILTCATLRVRFAQWPWPQPRQPGALEGLWGAIGHSPSKALLAIDAPQGLARTGQRMRASERALGAAGKTPDALPQPGSQPFAGFVRSGVELFRALHQAGCGLLGLDEPAHLLEGYPGAAWQRLAGRRLPSKSTPAGREARASLMRGLGVQGVPARPTHDQNDALCCAWLGYGILRTPDRVVTVGDAPYLDGDGQVREGPIVVPINGPA